LNDLDVGLIVVGQILREEKAIKLRPIDAMPIPVEISIQQHSADIISGKI
jgi:hypothetical protein